MNYFEPIKKSYLKPNFVFLGHTATTSCNTE